MFRAIGIITQLPEIIGDFFQWLLLLAIGFVAATKFDYAEDLHKIIVTIVSMSLGAVAVFFIKRLLSKYFKNK